MNSIISNEREIFMRDENRFYEMSLYKNYSEPQEFFKGTKLKNTIYWCHFVPLRATLPTVKKIFVLLLTTRRKFQYRPCLRMLRDALIEGLGGV